MGEGGWGREKEGGGREGRKEEEGKVESGVVRREGGYRAMSKLIWIWSQPCIHIMQAMWVGGESHGNLLSKGSLKLDWTLRQGLSLLLNFMI